MMMNKKYLLIIFFISLVHYSFGAGTKDEIENLYKYRFATEIEAKIIKGLKINLEPEFRFCEGLDKFNLSTGVTYKTFGRLYLGASYKLICNREVAGTVEQGINTYTEYKWDYTNRYALDLTYKHDLKRLGTSFRFRYTNYSDEDSDNEKYLRYRLKLDYNIKKCKFTPFISAEAFQRLEDNRIYKMRYTGGFEIKANKRSSFSVDYKFDYFLLKYTNAHIFSVGYKFSF